jgi:hypothetical protein
MSTQIANSDMLQGFAQLRREYRRGGNDPWEVIGQSDELHVAGVSDQLLLYAHWTADRIQPAPGFGGPLY